MNNILNDNMNISVIYELLINNRIIDYEEEIYYYFCGVKHEIEENYEEMKKYYLMAIDKGYSNAMNNLGIYYQHNETNYKEMKKYFLMAIEKNNTYAMFNLACYYQYYETNYEEMKKYYFMAIENGNLDALDVINIYYENL